MSIQNLESVAESLNPSMKVICMEPSEPISEMLKRNLRKSKEEESMLTSYTTQLMAGFEDNDVYQATVVEGIQCRRRLRCYQPYFEFTTNASEVPQNVTAHETLVKDILDLNTASARAGTPQPIYFDYLNERSWRNILKFQEFLKEVQDYFTFRVETIEGALKDCDGILNSLIESPEIWDRSDDIQLSYMIRFIETTHNAQINMLHIQQKLKDHMIILASIMEVVTSAYRELSTASVDFAFKLLKVKDFLFYSLEEYEKFLLEKIEVIRSIQSEILDMIPE